MTSKTIMAAILAAVALPAATQPLEPRVQGGTFVARDGKTLYETVCQGCHMPDAKGAEGAGRYPALAGDPKMAAGGYAAMLVVRGQKGMPAFGDLLDDDQVAAVVTYVRTHFGNAYAAPVTPAEVKALRRTPSKSALGSTAG